MKVPLNPDVAIAIFDFKPSCSCHKSKMMMMNRVSLSRPSRMSQMTRRRTVAPVAVLSESYDMAIGTKAPEFALVDAKSNKTITLSEYTKGSKATLIMFLAVHCKYVVHLKEAISSLAKEYQEKGVAVAAISSSSIITHPQDAPDKMAEDATKYGYSFPFVYDESQSVAKAYFAACTPEFYVFDSDLKLTYHGQFDDAKPSSEKPVTGKDLRAALDATLSGSNVPKSR